MSRPDQIVFAHDDMLRGSVKVEDAENINRTLVDFLNSEGQLQPALIIQAGPIPATFVIRRSDLTQEGQTLIDAYLSKWLRGIERSNRFSNTLVLRKGLKALRTA